MHLDRHQFQPRRLRGIRRGQDISGITNFVLRGDSPCFYVLPQPSNLCGASAKLDLLRPVLRFALTVSEHRVRYRRRAKKREELLEPVAEALTQAASLAHLVTWCQTCRSS